jgi:hypothetical protein
LKSLVERYLIGALGFAAAALWLGVGLIKGLECLLAFLLTCLVVTVVQRRQLVAERNHAHRVPRGSERGAARRGGAALRPDERHAGRTVSRSRPSRRPVYDDHAERGDWPQSAEHR